MICTYLSITPSLYIYAYPSACAFPSVPARLVRSDETIRCPNIANIPIIFTYLSISLSIYIYIYIYTCVPLRLRLAFVPARLVRSDETTDCLL